MNVGLLNYEPAKRLAAQSGIGACGPCSRVSPLSGLGVMDFGGGVNSAGMQQPMPALTPSYNAMMLQDGSHLVAYPMIDSYLERVVSEWENSGFSYGPWSPDQARQQLVSFISQRCGPPLGDNVDLRPTCSGIDTTALINRLVDHYTRWNNAKLAQYYDQLAQVGQQAPSGTPPPPDGYVPYNILSGAGGSPSPAPVTNNVLDTVVPQNQIWAQAPTANVLGPPTGSSTVPYSTIVQNVQGTPDLVTDIGGGSLDLSGASSWLKDNWVLLAVAGAALFLLGGRK